jgi:cell division protein FtsQ
MNIPHFAKIKISSVKNCNGLKPGANRKYLLVMRAVAILVLFLILGFGARHVYHRLCHWEFFQITAVKIEGTRMTSKEQIAALSKVDIHSNLLAVNVEQVESILDWPNRLLISLQEKNPVALLNRETGLFYLDKRGEIIAAAGLLQELDFPVITGFETFLFNTASSGRVPEPLRDALELLKLSNRNNPILSEQNISEIHVAENGELILYLLDRSFPIYLGSDGKISTRYYRLVKVLKDLYKTREFSEVSFIRLDYQKDTILVGKLETDRIDRG